MEARGALSAPERGVQAASAVVESTYRAEPPLPLARCAEPGERFLRTVRLCTGRACPRPSIPCRRVVESCGFSCGGVRRPRRQRRAAWAMRRETADVQ